MRQQIASSKKTTIYLPVELHQQLQVVARKHRRSLNNEIVWLLEQALKQPEGTRDEIGQRD